MKNKITICALSAAAAVLCTSCAQKAPLGNEAPKIRFAETSAYEADTEEYPDDGALKSGAAEALRAAMKGKRPVLELKNDERLFGLGGFSDMRYAEEVKDMTDMGLSEINLLEYCANKALSLTGETKWECFLTADLNRDGTDEVLLVGNDIRAVLHYAGGEVYFTAVPSEVFPSEVYENGVCANSEWSAWSLCHYMYYPAKGALYVDMPAYSDEGRYEENGSDIYEIDGKRVSREEYYAYVDGIIGGLTPLAWYDFTEENIDRYVAD
ncbi:MAG: hypothetical protein NC223_05400 [Butyrivibrio sp.]|nr:hypothetical protein [Butyrivibrio sp.]